MLKIVRIAKEAKVLNNYASWSQNGNLRCFVNLVTLPNTCLTKTEFLNGINLVLDSTYFSFNDKTYRQTFGVSMVSPLWPIILDIVLQNLESDILNKLIIKSLFYVRYMDDIALAIDKTYIDELCNMFNNYHPRLVTLKEGRGGGDRLNVLDVIDKRGSIP